MQSLVLFSTLVACLIFLVSTFSQSHAKPSHHHDQRDTAGDEGLRHHKHHSRRVEQTGDRPNLDEEEINVDSDEELFKGDWKVYDHFEFYKNELCEVLRCKRREVCLVKRSNAYCVSKDKAKRQVAARAEQEEVAAEKDEVEHENPSHRHKSHPRKDFEIKVIDDESDDADEEDDDESVDVMDHVISNHGDVRNPTPQAHVDHLEAHLQTAAPFNPDKLQEKIAKYNGKLAKSKTKHENEYEVPAGEPNDAKDHAKYVHVHVTEGDQLAATGVLPGQSEHVDRHDDEGVEKREPSKSTCSAEDLKAMGARVLKWFGDIHTLESKASNYHLPEHSLTCNQEVAWMFGQLDGDKNGRLKPQELWTLEHDQYEPCLRPYIDRCDQDADQDINVDEWCDCFQYAKKERDEPACHAARHRADPHLLGVYKPVCDSDGFYKAGQCHEGQCWCVDKWGREFPNSRILGTKAECGQYNDE